jgi:hypothetical protein
MRPNEVLKNVLYLLILFKQKHYIRYMRKVVGGYAGSADKTIGEQGVITTLWGARKTRPNEPVAKLTEFCNRLKFLKLSK